MAKITLALLLALGLVGCAIPQQKPETVYITAECPVPPTIPRPKLDIENIKSTDDPGTVIQAHRITIKTLQQWGLEQEAILNGYRKTK